MECHSCGRLTAASVECCPACGARFDGADQPARGTLVTDGGNGPDDDPLAPADDESESETPPEAETPPASDTDEEEYLDPEEIVEDDLNGEDAEAGASPTTEQSDQPTQDPGAGNGSGADSHPQDEQPGKQSPDTSQPRDRQPTGQSPDEQPQGTQPGEHAGGGSQPPDRQQTEEGQSQRGDPGGRQANNTQGGQPTDEQQGQGGRQANDTQGGQPSGHQPDSGQPQGTQPAGNTTQQSGQQDRLQQGSQPGTYTQGGGQAPGEPATDTTDTGGQFLEQMGQFPLKLGAALGALAFFIPYLLVTIASLWTYEESPTTDPELGAFDVGAEVFMTVAGFGSGDRIVDLFIRMADVDVTSPGEVDPADYPTVEDQLGPLLSLLDTSPEVPLLILYILAPYILFVSGRYLARHYSPSSAPVDLMVSSMSVVLGTLPIVFLVGLVFNVFAFLERLIFVGIFVPAIVGALGGLSIWLFDEQSALVSSLVGWLSIGASVAIGALLLPLPNLELDGSSLALSFLDRLVVALGSYLNALNFNMGAHNQGRLFFIIVALVTIAAGFVRTWRLDTEGRSRMYTAVAGSSIWLGFVATIALFLWVFPMSTIFVDVGFESALFGGSDTSLTIQSGAIDGSAGGAPIPTIERVIGVNSYLNSIIVGGFVFPAIFGGIGGYIAGWFNDR